MLYGKNIMNSKSVRISKEIIVSYLKVLSSHLSGGTEKIHDKSGGVSGNQAAIRTRYVSNKSLEHYCCSKILGESLEKVIYKARLIVVKRTAIDFNS